MLHDQGHFEKMPFLKFWLRLKYVIYARWPSHRYQFIFHHFSLDFGISFGFKSGRVFHKVCKKLSQRWKTLSPDYHEIIREVLEYK